MPETLIITWDVQWRRIATRSARAVSNFHHVRTVYLPSSNKQKLEYNSIFVYNKTPFSLQHLPKLNFLSLRIEIIVIATIYQGGQQPLTLSSDDYPFSFIGLVNIHDKPSTWCDVLLKWATAKAEAKKWRVKLYTLALIINKVSWLDSFRQ